MKKKVILLKHDKIQLTKEFSKGLNMTREELHVKLF